MPTLAMRARALLCVAAAVLTAAAGGGEVLSQADPSRGSVAAGAPRHLVQFKADADGAAIARVLATLERLAGAREGEADASSSSCLAGWHPSLQLLVAPLPPAALAYLAHDEEAGGAVEAVEPDVRAAGMDARGVAEVQRGAARGDNRTASAAVILDIFRGRVRGGGEVAWSLDRLDQRRLPLDDTFAGGEGGGRGVDLYVLDSGVRATHGDFAGRVAAGANFSPDQAGSDTSDPNGHGTHVASLAVGSTYGSAKSATLVPVRVYDESNSGPLTQALAGLEWTLARVRRGSRRAVVNLSWGGPASRVLNAAVSRLVAAGAVVVAAAGNEVNDACLLSPASARDALTVGATTVSDDFAPFSNYGPCVDVLAPGAEIPGAGSGSDSGERTMSGTSMAAPLTAGVAATYLSEHDDATPQQVVAALKCSATPFAVREAPESTTAALLYAPPGGYQGAAGECAMGGVGLSGAGRGGGGGGGGGLALALLAVLVLAVRG